MKMYNSIPMTDYLKAMFAVLVGFFSQWHYIAQVQPDPGTVAAVIRALLVGGASYVGVSIVKYTSKFVMKKWRAYKWSRK